MLIPFFEEASGKNLVKEGWRGGGVGEGGVAFSNACFFGEFSEQMIF